MLFFFFLIIGVPFHDPNDSEPEDTQSFGPTLAEFVRDGLAKRRKMVIWTNLKKRRAEIWARRHVTKVMEKLKELEDFQPKQMEYEMQYTGLMKSALTCHYDEEIVDAARAQIIKKL